MHAPGKVMSEPLPDTQPVVVLAVAGKFFNLLVPLIAIIDIVWNLAVEMDGKMPGRSCVAVCATVTSFKTSISK